MEGVKQCYSTFLNYDFVSRLQESIKACLKNANRINPYDFDVTCTVHHIAMLTRVVPKVMSNNFL